MGGGLNIIICVDLKFHPPPPQNFDISATDTTNYNFL